MWESIVHTAAAAEHVVWGYLQEVYPAQQTQPGSPHRERLCPCIMSSEERASKKTKTVDNESGTGK